MNDIVYIKGKVRFSITLDPAVWIFDDRRIDLNTYFKNKLQYKDSLEEYTKEISKHWDREIMEGATFPPTLKSERKFEKEKVLTGTFGIPFQPFLKNSEPTEDAEYVMIQTANEEIQITLNEAKDLILGFSKNGKPLLEDGPIYIFFGDGSNEENPIKNIKGFVIK